MLQEPAFNIQHAVGNGELQYLAPEFEIGEGQLSLPDLGGVSVDFANYEDYQRLEQPLMNFIGIADE